MKNKVVIIGCGNVGMSYAYALLNQKTAVNELALIDLDDKRIAKYINYRRAKKVEVEFNGIGDVSIDGELVHVKKFTAEIMEKAIKFVVPGSLVIELNGGEKELVH